MGKGLNYNEIANVDIPKYVGEAWNWDVVPKTTDVPAIPGDHVQKAVSIFFSYCKWLDYVATQEEKGMYMIIETDQSIRGDWEDQLKQLAKDYDDNADVILLSHEGDHPGGEGTPSIASWGVPGASAAKR